MTAGDALGDATEGADGLPGQGALQRTLSRKQSHASQLTLTKQQSAPHLMEMPTDDEIDQMFTRLVRDTLGEDKVDSQFTRTMTRENKWKMIVNSDRASDLYQSRYSPAFFLQAFSRQGQALADGDGKGVQAPGGNAPYKNVELISSLRIQLTNQPLS